MSAAGHVVKFPANPAELDCYESAYHDEPPEQVDIADLRKIEQLVPLRKSNSFVRGIPSNLQSTPSSSTSLSSSDSLIAGILQHALSAGGVHVAPNQLGMRLQMFAPNVPQRSRPVQLAINDSLPAIKDTDSPDTAHAHTLSPELAATPQTSKPEPPKLTPSPPSKQPLFTLPTQPLAPPATVSNGTAPTNDADVVMAAFEKRQIEKKNGKGSSNMKPTKKPAAAKAAVLKASAKKKVKNKCLAPPPDVIKKFKSGCSKCRYRAGCTPSCWRARGYVV